MPRRLAALLATALLALTACGGGEPAADQPMRGIVLDEPYAVPSTPLVDTDGEPFSLTDDTDARLTLVFFGYTHCPDICQVVMANLAAAMTRLDDADREQVDVVFVTTDPARDDERVLRDYLDRFDPSFVGLTGPLSTITEVGEPLKVFIEKGDELPSGGYDVSHGTQVTGIDHNDEAPVVWTNPTSAAEFASDIHTLLGEPS